MIRLIKPWLAMPSRLHGIVAAPERGAYLSSCLALASPAMVHDVARVEISPLMKNFLSNRHPSFYQTPPPFTNEPNGHTCFYALLGLLGLFGGSEPKDSDTNDTQKSSSGSKKKLTQLDTLIAKAILKMDSQEYDQANSLLHQALLMAQKERDTKSELLVMNLLAEDYSENGDLERAESVYIEIIRRMLAEGSVQQTDSEVLELSLRLASIYSRLPGKHSKAIQGFTFIIDNLTERLKDWLDKLDQVQPNELTKEVRNDLALLGWTYDWKAKHHIQRHEYSEAAIILKRALDISQVVLGRTHQQTLILFNDLGTALAMDNRAEEGCEYIQRAVNGASETNSEELASFCANLGLIYLQMMKLEQANQFCERSRQLAYTNKSHYSSPHVLELSRNCLDEVKKLVENS